jgi:hypothetical protein
MKGFVSLFVCISSITVFGASISEQVALQQAEIWMAGNPVMGPANRAIDAVETFPEVGTYSVYVVRLSPKGYLVLNSDDRLPLVVGFSPDSGVDLSDHPDNAFRTMLETYVAKMEDELSKPWKVAAQSDAEPVAAAETELYGPFLETIWNQNNPYNLYCPDDPEGSQYYDYRAAVGCVPTAYAQLLAFHRWPVHGSGTHSYTDDSGSITGMHSAVFSDNYAWDLMQEEYDAWDTDVDPTMEAVAELMYELGVAAEADYENGGTLSSTYTLGNRLGDYFFFEPISYHSSSNTLIPPLEADLRDGFPCVVSIPGHAIVADGLMVDDGETTYHINYGWGGSNNGWWSADNVDGDALGYGVTSLRPRLLAFPQTNSVVGNAGESAELRWILPKRRELEAAALTIKEFATQTNDWAADGSEILGTSSGWEVVSAGHSGDCWFSDRFVTSSMTLDEVFVPGTSSELAFWLSCRLASATFSVSVSTNDGASYAEIFSVNYHLDTTWARQTISLAAFAGKEIRLRFAVSYGSYYSEGGVWLDDLTMTTAEWRSWQTFMVDDVLASRRFSETTNVWDECVDFSVFENTSTSTSKDWVCTSVSGADTCFFKVWGGSGEYHLTARETITPTLGTRLLLRLKGNFFYDAFRVKVSTDGSTFSQVWWTDDTEDWNDVSIDLAAYAGQPIYVRLEYQSGSNFSDGGVWIDSISLAEAGSPELEGQPIYYTALTNLPAGTHTLAAVLTDTNAVEHALGPTFTLTVSGGDDGDGIPSDWEIQYGLDPDVDDGGLDSDDDGFSNWQEYICGTVPTNAASVWKLTMGSGSLPAFQGLDNRLYTIEYCDGLASNDWKSIATEIVGSNGLFEVSSFESATNACRFYRVTVQEAD